MPIQHEYESEAHRIFRSYKSHTHQDQTTQSVHEVPGIVQPGSTGVLYVTDRAMKNGFTYGANDWANFGQGAPETGQIEGSSELLKSIDLQQYGDQIHEYAPTTGVKELRQAVATYYNDTFRNDNSELKPFTYENVCIVPGGRAGLTRIASVIGDAYTGYQLPDYTAYEQLLTIFRRIVPIPTHLDSEKQYKLHVDRLRQEIRGRGLRVVLMSNPRNPTGVVIKGQELDELVSVGREGNCTLILDEFYSWYIYDNDDDAKTPDRGDSKTSSGNAISAASYIRDINAESTVIVDGLTKGFRKPGWRIAWVVGPRELIAALNQCGGYLDGGASHPLQMAAVPLLDPSRTRQDRAALQKHFKHKRDFVISRLNQMGFKQKASSGTFYVWLNLSHLPEPLNSGLVFFEECLREKVIVVPGVFFDVNPSHRRNLMNSPCHHYVRLSFGPPLEQLQRGLEGIEHVINKLKETHPENGTLGKGYIGSDDQSKNSKHLAAISVSGAAI